MNLILALPALLLMALVFGWPMLRYGWLSLHASSVLTGLGTLEGKESPRLSVLAGFCRSLGCAVEVGADRLAIGPSAKPAGRGTIQLDGHGDHRMVFAALLLGLVEPGVRIAGHHAVAKSWSRALTDLEELGLRFDETLHG